MEDGQLSEGGCFVHKNFLVAALRECEVREARRNLGKRQYSTGESCERGRIRDTKPVRAGAIEDIGNPFTFRWTRNI